VGRSMPIKHTPGPWTVAKDNREQWVIETTLVTIATLSDNVNMDFENAYNAHLIAAAPDMLVALEVMCKAFMDYDGQSENEFIALSVSKKAITKAKGETK